MKILLIIFSFVYLFSACGDKGRDELILITGATMGTTYSVKYLNNISESIENVKVNIEETLQTVNAQMSTYIPDSELSRFNSSSDTSWFSISNDLAFVLNSSLEICELTNGALDITVGPLVNIWGFGPENKPTAIPTEAEINSALETVSWKNIEVRLNPPAVKKKMSKIYCDLSSTAKGFGVDKVSGYLASIGVKNYLVEIGGELRAFGTKSKGEEWRIGISKPNNNSSIQEVIKLNNTSMATSGDYWNYFEEDGIRYSHTINPKTGRPISHKLASITILAETCLLADGLATAIDVMGEIKGLEFATENSLCAYFITRENDQFVVNYTESFNKLILEN